MHFKETAELLPCQEEVTFGDYFWAEVNGETLFGRVVDFEEWKRYREWALKAEPGHDKLLEAHEAGLRCVVVQSPSHPEPEGQFVPAQTIIGKLDREQYDMARLSDFDLAQANRRGAGLDESRARFEEQTQDALARQQELEAAIEAAAQKFAYEDLAAVKTGISYRD